MSGRRPISGSLINPTFTMTQEVILSPDPNFPTGYIFNGTSNRSFDWARNVTYQAIYGGTNGGITVTDMGTMRVTRTATLNQMYAGTPYGDPPGVPPAFTPDGPDYGRQNIYDLTCGNGTDIYLLMNGLAGLVPGEITRFTRLDANTLKITGEYYTGGAFPPAMENVTGSTGVVNKTVSKTVVAYTTNAGLGLGPQIFDGSGMGPIGMGPTPAHSAYQCFTIAGPRGGNACDFIMLNWDQVGGSVDIWRIRVYDEGSSWSIAAEITGTFNGLTLFPDLSALTIVSANYDIGHNAILMSFSYYDSLPPIHMASINFDGSVNWKSARDVGPAELFKGQSSLTGSSLMIGGTGDFILLDTGTGQVTFEGPVTDPPILVAFFGSFFKAYNAASQCLYAYGLSVGFLRVCFSAQRTTGLEWITCCDRAIMAHLYQFITATGLQDYFTDFDLPIAWNGVIWKSDGLRFEGLQRKIGVGLSVDEQNLKIWASPGDTIFGGNFLSGVEEGILDGAIIVRRRIVWEFISGNVALDIQNPPLAVWTLFTGYTSSIAKGGVSHIELKVKSALSKLNVNMPRNYYQPGCLWTLYDKGCTLPKALYGRTTTILAAPDARTIAPAGGIDPAVGPDGFPFYAQGRLLFNSGVNAGLQVLIDTNEAVDLYLSYPLNDIPNVGDSITFYPGCSKSYVTCQLKFNNQNNFRGFDKVPPVFVSV